jgi:hypothetical protein
MTVSEGPSWLLQRANLLTVYFTLRKCGQPRCRSSCKCSCSIQGLFGARSIGDCFSVTCVVFRVLDLPLVPDTTKAQLLGPSRSTAEDHARSRSCFYDATATCTSQTGNESSVVMTSLGADDHLKTLACTATIAKPQDVLFMAIQTTRVTCTALIHKVCDTHHYMLCCSIGMPWPPVSRGHHLLSKRSACCSTAAQSDHQLDNLERLHVEVSERLKNFRLSAGQDPSRLIRRQSVHVLVHLSQILLCRKVDAERVCCKIKLHSSTSSLNPDDVDSTPALAPIAGLIASKSCVASGNCQMCSSTPVSWCRGPC